MILSIKLSFDERANKLKACWTLCCSYELTHGLTYLVFKYQLHDPNLLRRGEITDYTEPALIVKRTAKCFSHFLNLAHAALSKQFIIFYVRPDNVKRRTDTGRANLQISWLFQARRIR